jgi:hypothetical protein
MRSATSRAIFGELAGELRPTRSVGRQRTGCAAELQLQRLVESLRQPSPASVHRTKPACGLITERRRRGRLEKSARQHNGLRMLIRKRLQSAFETGVILLQNLPRVAEKQNQRGVEDILAGRAPVNEPCRIGIGFADASGQCLDERDGYGGGLARFLRQRCGSEAIDVRDGVGGALRNHA